MTHHEDHNHNHSDDLDNHVHDHSHSPGSHSHKHSHGSDNHAHSHHHSEETLSLAQKFSMLLKHWIDHNNSHKESYLSWADKADFENSGKNNLSEAANILRKTAELSEQITEQLQNALKSIKD
ncbi:MAG: hypothetical protein HQK69_01280 [Desulfamplus sp.]|nr:hypothetical protein [Desulfamplus sp.]